MHMASMFLITVFGFMNTTFIDLKICENCIFTTRQHGVLFYLNGNSYYFVVGKINFRGFRDNWNWLTEKKLQLVINLLTHLGFLIDWKIFD